MKNKILNNVKLQKTFPDYYLDAANYNYSQILKNRTKKVNKFYL